MGVGDPNTVVGFQNLGNTCYMNAALQCLLHTRLLREYFESEFSYDLNPDSKRSQEWGLGGKLAVTFADLVAEIAKNPRVVAPERIRRSMSQLKAEFAGWQQHDAQEFLTAFLEGLGEDLNRVPNKPYIELKDSAERDDVEVAAECWNAQLRRDWSIVVALFFGQFKSTLRCTECSSVNSSFESFSIVQVPFPEHDGQWITTTLVKAGPQHVQVSAKVPKQFSVGDILDSVSEVLDIPSNDLIVADAADGCILAQLPREAHASWGPHSLIYHAPQQPDDVVVVYLVHRRLRRTKSYFLNPYRVGTFVVPQVLRLPPHSKAIDLYKAVWAVCSRVIPDYRRPSSKNVDEEWPFRLSRVARDGLTCSKCGWIKGCLGCPVDISVSEPVRLGKEETLGVDWNAVLLSEYYNEYPIISKAEHKSVASANNDKNAPKELRKCLSTLLQEEEVPAYCKTCTKRRGGEFTEPTQVKAFSIWSLPPVLVFQLKRFNIHGGHTYKVANLVEFPLELDVREYLADGDTAVAGPTLSRSETRYSLYGVVNHIGGFGSGHYTACVWSRPDRQWWYCDDGRCFHICPDEVVTSHAYLLFFLRKDMEDSELEKFFPRQNGTDSADLESVRDTPPSQRAKAPRRGGRPDATSAPPNAMCHTM